MCVKVVSSPALIVKGLRLYVWIAKTSVRQRCEILVFGTPDKGDCRALGSERLYRQRGLRRQRSLLAFPPPGRRKTWETAPLLCTVFLGEGESRRRLGNGSRQKPGVVRRRRRRRAHGCSSWRVEILTPPQQRETGLLPERARPKPSRWKERRDPRPGERPAKPRGSPSASSSAAPSCSAPRFSWVSEKVEARPNAALPSPSAGWFVARGLVKSSVSSSFPPCFVFIPKWKCARKGICCGSARAGRCNVSSRNFLNAEFEFGC